jgi:hypothetical protein
MKRITVVLAVAVLMLWAPALEAASVTLAWDPNPEPDIAGYTICYGVQPGVYTNSINVGNQTSFVVPDLTAGQRYYFMVQAYNTAGLVSLPSQEVTDVPGGEIVPAPLAWIDTPVEGQSVMQPFHVAGWAIDRAATSDSGVDAVHVYAYPDPGSGAPPVFLGIANHGLARPDVGAAFGPQFNSSGYALSVNGLAPGSYQITVLARSIITGSFDATWSVRITIVPSTTAPRMWIDIPSQGNIIHGSFVVGGWALDLGSTSGPGVDAVHVYAYPDPGSGRQPIFLGAAGYGGIRQDVGAAFGSRFIPSGFGLNVASLGSGTYDLVAFARSTVAGEFNNSQVVRIEVEGSSSVPRMWIDAPQSGSTVSSSFAVLGWALDLGAEAGTGVDAVHVWAYPNPESGQAPVFLGVAAQWSRPDVAAVFGEQFRDSGYHLTAGGLAPGSYDVVVYARSTLTGTFNNAHGFRLNVQ